MQKLGNARRVLWYHSAEWRTRLLPGRNIPGNRILFVCGCYNSGTTLIADYLRESCGLPGLSTEGDSLVSFLTTPEKLGFSRYPSACLEQIDRATAALTESHAQRASRIWAAAYGYRPIQGYFVEKSISHALRLPWLRSVYPDAQFLWIKRNPYCAIEGMLRRSQRNQTLNSLPDIKTATDQWKLLSGRISAFFQVIEENPVVHYEDFTLDAEKALARVGFPTSNAGAAPSHKYTFRFHGEKRGIMNDNASSLSRLSQTDFDIINANAGNEIYNFGYERIDGP